MKGGSDSERRQTSHDPGGAPPPVTRGALVVFQVWLVPCSRRIYGDDPRTYQIRARIGFAGFWGFGPPRAFSGSARLIATGWLDNQPSSIDMRAIFDRMIVWTTSGRADAWLVAPQLLVRAATDRPLAAVIQKRYARFRRKLTTVIERWQSEGAVRSDIPADFLPIKSALWPMAGR